MKVCFLEGDMSRHGGTERMTSIIANEMVEKNNIYIISMEFKNDAVFYQLDKSICHKSLKNYNGKFGIIKKIFYVHHFIKKKNIDCIINVDTGLGFFGIIASVFTKCKVITWEHANYYNNWNSKIFPYLRIFAAKYSDIMVVLTEKDKFNYSKNIKSKKPIYVIPNPIKKNNFKYDITSKIILSAGFLTPIKQFDLIIDLSKKLFLKYPNWRWVICGDGPERKKLEELINYNYLQNNVYILGDIKDMENQYKKASFYVMTSKMEGLPMVLLEAKSWGLPLVSFDIMTGPSDIINNNLNGYLIEPYNLDEMYKKIEQLIIDRDLRLKFSKNSQIGIDKFNLKNIIERWRNIIQ